MSIPKHRSSGFSMGEDVYLLTKSAPALDGYDEGRREEASHSYTATPRMQTSRKTMASSAVSAERSNSVEENRLNSIKTVLSSLFGGMSVDNQQTTNIRSSMKRSSDRGIYRFFQKDFSTETNIALILCYILVLCYSIFICIGPILLAYILPAEEWCVLTPDDSDSTTYANPDYITDPCRYLRVPQLFYLTLEECDMSRRLLCSVVLGGIIGYERRSADRPAGIRTMGLVSLGAASFTISSIMAFRSSPMGWDASRVTAALPSGVGFLGGALIWKGSVFVNGVGEVHQVNGLTTAASVWLSAAVGVGSGGALYLVTIYVVILVIMILRYAPRSYLIGIDDANKEGEVEVEADEPTNEQSTYGEPQTNEQAQLSKEESLIRMLSISGTSDNDFEEDEEMDKVSSMRNTSSHGLGEDLDRASPPKPQRLPSNKMLKSRSTGSLRASLRAQVPTFGE